MAYLRQLTHPFLRPPEGCFARIPGTWRAGLNKTRKVCYFLFTAQLRVW